MFFKVFAQLVIWFLFIVVLIRNIMVGRKKKGKNAFSLLSRIISIFLIILGFTTPLPIYPFLILSIILLFTDYRFRLTQPELGDCK